MEYVVFPFLLCFYFYVFISVNALWVCFGFQWKTAAHKLNNCSNEKEQTLLYLE